MTDKRVTFHRFAGPNERLVEGAIVGLDLVLESLGRACRVTFPEHFGEPSGPDNLPFSLSFDSCLEAEGQFEQLKRDAPEYGYWIENI